MYRFGLLTLITLSPTYLARAQASLSVTPAYAVVTGQAPYGSFLLRNDGTEPLELTITAHYGVIASNDTTTGVLLDQGGALHDLGRRLAFFPRRSVLEPGQSQTVRYRVEDAASAPLGGHITLMHFAMQERGVVNQDQIPALATALNIVYNLVAPLVYLNGTGAATLTASIENVSDSELTLRLENQSIWPFLGGVSVQVGAVELGRMETAVYTERIVTIPWSVNSLPTQVTLHFDTDYTGLPHTVRSILRAPSPMTIRLQR